MSERRLYAIELSYNYFLLVPREKLSAALDLLEGSIAKKQLTEDYKDAGYVRVNEPLAITSVLESEVLAAELRARAGPAE